MRKLTCVVVVVGALGGLAAATPASAAVGQCFDRFNRPFGPPHNTANPPYGMICDAYRRGGWCTHVQPRWVAGNCGIGPRYQYRDYRYRDDGYRWRRDRYDSDD